MTETGLSDTSLPDWRQIVTFWFEDIAPEQWWTADPAFDRAIDEKFAALLSAASRGELFSWRATPEGRLAEIVVLDQFSRNVYRGTPRAFAQDGMALTLAQEAVLRDVHRQLPAKQVAFLLMPYMHSESRAIHVQAEMLFRDYAPANYDYELRHKAIIDRFGRYPHRNTILGRESTPEEIVFLQQPGSGF